MKRINWLLLTLALLCAGCGTAPAGETQDTTPYTTPGTTEKEPEMLRIVSFNIQVDGGHAIAVKQRAPELKKILDLYSPDSIGFQEVSPNWLYFLKKNLEGYTPVGESREGKGKPGEGNQIFYKTDKFELLETNTFWLSETPDTPSLGWDAMYNRVCTYAVLKNKETGSEYVHINTHIDHAGTTAQTEQLRMITAFAAARFAGQCVVLTGDFNVPQGSAAYNIAINGTLFADSKTNAAVTDSGGTFIPSNDREDKPIDFILYSDAALYAAEYRVIRDKLSDWYVSDHFGVFAVFEIRK